MTKTQSKLPRVMQRKWASCTRCEIHKFTERKTLFRGSLPCDFLLIGEAPGPKEHQCGVPFVGPAGDLLDGLLISLRSECAKHGIPPFSVGICNAICCFPAKHRYTRGGHLVIEGFREPLESEINNCRDHLLELIELCSPRGVVYMGKISHSYARPTVRQAKRSLRGVQVHHPSFLLRNQFYTDASLQFRQWVSKVRHFISTC